MADQYPRFTREILNRDSMRQIANSISAQIQRTLNATEIEDLFAFVRQHATQNWNAYNTSQIRQALTRSFLNSRFTAPGRAKVLKSLDNVDVHEILKAHIGTTDQEPDMETATNVDENGHPIDLKLLYSDSDTNGNPVAEDGTPAKKLGSLDNISSVTKVLQVMNLENITSFMGKKDDAGIQTLLNPQAAWRKNYIILDSRYRDTSQDVPGATTISVFTWNFLAKSSVNAAGGVNSLGDVQNVIEIGCPNIRIPYVSNILVNSYKRVTMLINEFSGQSYIGQESRRFHFMYGAELDNNMIECSVLPNNTGTFEFAKPITQLDTFTVSFGAPLEPIAFDIDRLVMAVTYSNPATFTASQNHNLQTGDQVYISNFTTLDPATDNAIITAANATSGYNIFVSSATSFQIPDLDFTTVTAPINPMSIQIYFGSKRIFVPITLKYIAAAKNNQ